MGRDLTGGLWQVFTDERVEHSHVLVNDRMDPVELLNVLLLQSQAQTWGTFGLIFRAWMSASILLQGAFPICIKLNQVHTLCVCFTCPQHRQQTLPVLWTLQLCLFAFSWLLVLRLSNFLFQCCTWTQFVKNGTRNDERKTLHTIRVFSHHSSTNVKSHSEQSNDKWLIKSVIEVFKISVLKMRLDDTSVLFTFH